MKDVFEKRLGIVKKADIATLCPDISETTIERTLKDLLEAGFIEKIGKGRATGNAEESKRIRFEISYFREKRCSDLRRDEADIGIL